MKNRRSFIVFILLRLLAWGTVATIIVVFLVGIGLFERIPTEGIVALGILAIVTSFFEFDSLPRKIEIRGETLILVDPSGEEIVSADYGLRRYLWLTRVVICRNRRVLSIPLEAYRSTLELTKNARGRIPKRVEQASDGKPDHAAS